MIVILELRFPALNVYRLKDAALISIVAPRC
jgi:hypothetical protein